MTDAVNRAFLFALRVHGGQLRKDGKPYLIHPFSVATALARDGADDALICAGLLHDTVEDGGVLPEDLRREFGEEVLRLVLFDTEDKSLSWKDRKTKTLQALKECDRSCAMLICADKLSNLCDIAGALEQEGEIVWSRFRYGREQQEWLYRSYLDALERLSDRKMYRDLSEMVEIVFPKGEETLCR